MCHLTRSIYIANRKVIDTSIQRLLRTLNDVSTGKLTVRAELT